MVRKTKAGSSQHQVDILVEIAVSLSSETKLNKLLENIIYYARQVTNSDGGTLYLVEGDQLHFKIIQNTTLGIFNGGEGHDRIELEPVPLEKTNVCAYAALLGETVNIEDVYCSRKFDFSGPKHYDSITGYRCKSMLVVPMKNNEGKVIGVLQLLNATDRKTHLSIPFPEEGENIIEAMASMAAIAIEKAVLYRQLQAYNTMLERQVEDRTKALMRANTELTEQKEYLQKAFDELKSTQKRLIEAEKMASLGKLVAGVAHEINTPVGVGIGLSSNLMERTEKMSGDYHADRVKKKEFEHYLKTVHDAGSLILKNLQRTGDLVKSFKQISVDEITEQKREFFLKSYIEDVLRSLHHELKNMPLKTTINCDSTLSIYSFPGAFAQILTNLIMNSKLHAFKDMHDCAISISVQRNHNQLELVFENNGPNIEPEIMENIFEPFFTTDKQTGSGLGLYIVYNLTVHKLQGTVSCENLPKQGVRFRCFIPTGEEK